MRYCQKTGLQILTIIIAILLLIGINLILIAWEEDKQAITVTKEVGQITIKNK